jgi:hypothetical protein
LLVVAVLGLVGMGAYRRRVIYRYYNPLEISVWTEFGVWHAAVSEQYVKGRSNEVRDAALRALREALAAQLAEDFDPAMLRVTFDHRDIREGVVTTHYVASSTAVGDRA